MDQEPRSKQPILDAEILEQRDRRLAKQRLATRQWRERHPEYKQPYDKAKAAASWRRYSQRLKKERPYIYEGRKAKHGEQTRLWQLENPDRVKELNRRHQERLYKSGWHRQLKIEVLTYYGGGQLVCAKCRFSEMDGLVLDHINDGGRLEKRKKDGNRMIVGNYLYGSLKRNGFPPGYQTLCANCNQIKEIKRLRAMRETQSR